MRYLLHTVKEFGKFFLPLEHALDQSHSTGIEAGTICSQRDGEQDGNILSQAIFLHFAITTPRPVYDHATRYFKLSHCLRGQREIVKSEGRWQAPQPWQSCGKTSMCFGKTAMA
jgi:hypothetical protein